MVINNLLDDVLTDLCSDYFIYLVNRYQLSEINIKCFENVRGQFSKRWRTGLAASPRDWSVWLTNDHESLWLVSHHRDSLWLVGSRCEVSWGQDYFLILALRWAVSQLICASRIHTYHQLNPDCKIMKPSIRIARAQQEHHESAIRGWVAFLVRAFSKPTTMNCYHSCGRPR